MIEILKELCKGCGYCVEFCPKKVLKIGLDTNQKGYQYATVAEPDNCISCGICATMCPDVAINLYK